MSENVWKQMKYILFNVRTVLYKCLAISLSLMDSALHSVKFTSPAVRTGDPLALHSAENATQRANINDEFIVTKCPIESDYPFVCSV